MPFDTGLHASAGQSAAVDVTADQLIARAGRGGIGGSAREGAKIEKAGKDFESILLGSWLQQAEQSFATVPGGDGEGEDDSGKDQFSGIAMQALAGSLTAHGGIGIAKMISKHLQASGSAQKPAEAALNAGKAGS